MIDPNQRLTDVEQHTLLAVWRLGSRSFGAAIRDELEQTTGRRVTVSAIYSTVIRLEERGFVFSRLTDPLPVRGGKAKRLFAITDRGIAALRGARHEMDRLWDGLDSATETGAP